MDYLKVLHEAQTTVALSVGGWILMFPVRTLIKKAKDFFSGFEAKLSSIETELTTQRTNCLRTLQEQGVTQTVVLKEVAGTLNKMHESQIEMTGYFKGKDSRG